MQWHWTEALSVFHHLPHSLGDLLHHEDAALVKAGAPGLLLKKPKASAVSGIEKDIDPAISRSQQNFGLLIRDYLHALPDYASETQASEALLEHWRTILREQQQRLAEAHMGSWNNEHSKHFWRERLHRHTTDSGIAADHLPTAIDDWERSAGSVVPDLKTLGVMQTKQWQDLVIRQRIHNLEFVIGHY